MSQEYPKVGHDAPSRFLIIRCQSPKRCTCVRVLDFEVTYNR